MFADFDATARQLLLPLCVWVRSPGSLALPVFFVVISLRTTMTLRAKGRREIDSERFEGKAASWRTSTASFFDRKSETLAQEAGAERSALEFKEKATKQEKESQDQILLP